MVHGNSSNAIELLVTRQDKWSESFSSLVFLIFCFAQGIIADDQGKITEDEEPQERTEVEYAEDAQDFADEDELIEDETEQLLENGGLAAAKAALEMGGAAEEEDYDFDEDQMDITESEKPNGPVSQDNKPGISQAVSLPQSLFSLQPVTPTEQPERARQVGVKLPILGQFPNGEAALAFTDLFKAPSVQPARKHKLPAAMLDRLKDIAEQRAAKGPSATLTSKKKSHDVMVSEEDDETFHADIEDLKKLGVGVRTTDEEEAEAEEVEKEAYRIAISRIQAGKIPYEMQISSYPEVRPEKKIDQDRRDLQKRNEAIPVLKERKRIQEKREEEKGKERSSKDHPAGKKHSSALSMAEIKVKRTGSKQAAELQAQDLKTSTTAYKASKGHHLQQRGQAPSYASDAQTAIAYPVIPDYVFDGLIQQPWEREILMDGQSDVMAFDASVSEHESDSEGAASHADVLPSETYQNRADGRRYEDIQAWKLDMRVEEDAKGDLVPLADENIELSGIVTTAPLLRFYEVPGGESRIREHQNQVDVSEIAGAVEKVLPMKSSLMSMAWENMVSLEGGVSAADKLRQLKLVLDLNDSNMIFEQQGNRKGPSQLDGRLADMLQHSAVTLLPVQARAVVKGVEPASADEAAALLAKVNISKDKEYFERRKVGINTSRIYHSRIAAQLQTIPLRPDPTELDSWHRPRGRWWPLNALKVKGRIKLLSHRSTRRGQVVFYTLLGAEAKVNNVDFDTVCPDAIWKHVTEHDANFKDAAGFENPAFLIPGKPPLELPPNRPFGSSMQIQGTDPFIISAFRQMHLITTDVAEEIPDEQNTALLRPPMAFNLRKDLTAATSGRVILVEYMEETPLLLNRPGMGARLSTFYRRKDPADKTHLKIRREAEEAGQSWKVGNVSALGETDESPFLGDIAPGSSQLAVETGLYTAPACVYNTPPSEFLLTRSSAGVMRLRELTGTVATGQQLPHHRIPFPNSRDLKDLEERRMLVYILRTLRTEQRKLDRHGGGRAEVALSHLIGLFPNRPSNMIRLFLKDVPELMVSRKDAAGLEVYALRDGVRPPTEVEIKKKLLPEEACILDAYAAAERRLRNRGLNRYPFYLAAMPEKVRLAAEMLPSDGGTQAAAKVVEQAVSIMPWTLTDAFVAAFRENRATLRLLGAGDPSGRGFGYSFVRDVRHKGMAHEDAAKSSTRQRSGKLQGTDADLRRMTTEQARQKLLRFGLTEEEIEPLTRWVRIDLVRQLANASAADGSDVGIAKYVRHQKTTLIELQKRYRERAQQIFERQTAVLADEAGEDLGDQAALEAAVEAELLAEDEGHEKGDDQANDEENTPKRKVRK